MSELQRLRLRIAQLEELEKLKGKKAASAPKSKKRKESKNTATFASGLRPAYYSTTTSRSPPSTRADSPDGLGGLDDGDLYDVRPTPSDPILTLSTRVPMQNQLANLAKVKVEKVWARLSANAVRANDLPSFVDVDNRWKEVYLPTLYHTFYLSAETFSAFKSSSSAFIKTIQAIVDLVYPYKDYTVTGVGDPIVLMSYNRINGARSSIASDAMREIQEYIRKTYAGKPSEAYEWLCWARCLEYGPLFFENPTPLHLIGDPEDPDFVYPSGRLRSPFLLSVVRNALDGIDGTMKDRSLVPGGLFAMAMGALERAARAIKPDASCDTAVLANFCQVKWGEAIAGYYEGFSNVSSAKWAIILSLCQDIPQNTGATINHQEVHIIQRVNIFNFKSPTK
ncbi:hypothetical protein EST38_g9703 [Candolleomyces aberdarensis]|uniref:Uncharacterized protein n=1 Tax=Candolleomyces aberdarensis TaxID=2316362 RepID=A0A4Q2DBG2_9AGAR|nr:hypothetical protein EST38_g9703 [Candolleomyces aberdarensis]